MTPLGRSDTLQMSRLTLHLSGVICPLPKRPLGPHPSPLSRDMNYIVTAERREKFALGQMVTVGSACNVHRKTAAAG